MNKNRQQAYHLYQTYKELQKLINMYGLDLRHFAVRKAAQYILSNQRKRGDYIGLLGKQYVPYYAAVFTETLILAGYEKDRSISKTFNWLESMRQDDGGWALPMRTVGKKLGDMFDAETYEPDRSKPFSHLITGMVLRAYAVHPEKRKSKVAKEAGALLKSRFFVRDKYPDHAQVEHWIKFQYPFFWTNLLMALDSLSLLGFKTDDPDIEKGLEWFIKHQLKDGLWPLTFKLLK